MATISFFLRNAKQEVAELYVRYRDGRSIDLKAKSGISITRDSWNMEKQTFKRGIEMEKTHQASSRMQAMKDRIEQEMLSLKNQGLDITLASFKDIIDRFHGRVKGRNKDTLTEYMQRFIEEAENGSRLVKEGERYKESTIMIMKSFVGQFKEYQEVKKPVNFNNITMGFYQEYTSYYTTKGLRPNTIGRYVKHLKTFMRAALEEGLHNNHVIDNKHFQAIKVEVDAIYLSNEEIQKIFELDLKERKELEIVRDVFLVGCYTAQRYSDYCRIIPEHIRELDDGERVIVMTQQKGGEQVFLPIKPELEQILQKYDYRLPKTHGQKVNERIKEIACLAGITNEIIVEETIGGMRVKRTAKKCDLVTTHTARRSGATNMHLAGISPIYIMKITGHKSEKQLLQYIKTTKEEAARLLSQHDYFKNPSMRVMGKD